MRLSDILSSGGTLALELSARDRPSILTLICGRPSDLADLYLDRRWSQFYFGGPSGSNAPFFVEESVGEPRLNHEVVDAFLGSATREIDKSLQSWSRRAVSVR